MSGVPFRGVSSSADTRFTDKEKKLLKSTKFPKEFDQKIPMKKIKWEAMRPWIATRVTELLGVEDEVLIGYIYEQLEGHDSVDPRVLQINLTGFLEKNTSLFVKELWALLASAAETTSGIPQKLLDDKEAELKARQEREDKINENFRKNREKQQAERREAAKKEEEARERRRKEREAEREKERQWERKQRETEREEREAREKERAREREKRREAERERDRKLEKEREARRAEDRKERQKRDQERALDRGRGNERKDKMGVEDSASRSLSPTANGGKRDRLEDGTGAALGEEPDAKKARKEKKAKKEKKEKKGKKEKRDKKSKKEKRAASGSPGSGSGSPDTPLNGGNALVEDLRKKALLSNKKEVSP